MKLAVVVKLGDPPKRFHPRDFELGQLFMAGGRNNTNVWLRIADGAILISHNSGFVFNRLIEFGDLYVPVEGTLTVEVPK